MSIGLGEEHRALGDAVRRWAADRCPSEAVRTHGDRADPAERPRLWDELAAQGWLGLHVPEELGGSGYGVLEAAVLLEQLGRALVPGPVLPTVLTSAVLAHAGGPAAKRLVPGLADGRLAGAVTLGGGGLVATRDADGVVLDGTARTVLGGPEADLVVVVADHDGRELWAVVDAADADVEAMAATDATRGVATVRLERVRVPADRVLTDLDGDTVRDLAGVLVAAEAAGVAGWCVDATARYARSRTQFGRPIGQFQAVKHRLADMLTATEQARAVAWDAARAWDAATVDGELREQSRLAATIARAVASEVAYDCARHAIQLHGGIGFTWEHDAHLYLRRAVAVRGLCGGAPRARRRVAELARAGSRRRLELDLGDALADFRSRVRALLQEIAPLDPADQRRRIADGGWIAPHYPEPWGVGASPAEQLVVDQEFRAARIPRPHLQVGGWALPTIIAHGTAEQQERFVGPTLRGELTWCQLFSEPEAGSDLASLRMRAVRVEGGWSLTGQKVWTSLAQEADYGICLARTDPTAAKHAGITYFLVDMTAPGIEIRPLRELTGMTMFNEVFLTDVFVPDDLVVGDVHDGWRVARDTLAAERVAMSSGSSFGGGLEGLLKALANHPDADDPLVVDELGRLLCEAQAVAVMNHRATLMALAGREPPGGASIRKLLGVEHQQRVSELVVELLGADGALADGHGHGEITAFLFNRCLTIAGGTSEVQRNVIGERALGLPRLEEPGG